MSASNNKAPSEHDESLETALANKDWNKVSQMLFQLVMDVSITQVKAEQPELKELTYVKVPIYTEKGSYLLTIMHFDGEKIQLQDSLPEGQEASE